MDVNPMSWWGTLTDSQTGAFGTTKLPNTLGQISVLGSLFGAVSGTIGSYYNAKAQASAMEHSARMASINAQISELGAQMALKQGEQQVGMLTMKAGRIKSAQRAAMAANGIDLGVGSAAEVTASTDLMKEIDANTIMANAMQSAWGYRTQAMNYQNEALTKSAYADSVSPLSSAAGTLLGNAGQVASQWYAFKKQGGTLF